MMGDVQGMRLVDCVSQNKRVMLFIQECLIRKFKHKKEHRDYKCKITLEDIPKFDRFEKDGWVMRSDFYRHVWPNAASAQQSFASNLDLNAWKDA